MENYGYESRAYDDGFHQWDELEQQDSLPISSLRKHKEEPDSDDYNDFNILDDIDTVLFFRVNSFVHSVTGTELNEIPFHLGESAVNEAPPKLASEERSDFASSKINFYFRELINLLRPDQVHMVHKIHRTLGRDIGSVLDYFHARSCQILTPSQVATVH